MIARCKRAYHLFLASEENGSGFAMVLSACEEEGQVLSLEGTAGLFDKWTTSGTYGSGVEDDVDSLVSTERVLVGHVPHLPRQFV